jgi:adenylate cyclase
MSWTYSYGLFLIVNMRLINPSLLITSLHHEWRKIALLGWMFLLFISNAVGLVQFGSDLWPGVDFNLDYLKDANGKISLPPLVTSIEFILLLSSGLILTVLLPLLKPITASMLVLALAIPPIWVAIEYPYHYNTIPMEFNLLVLLVLFGINVLMKYFAETQEKQKLLATFTQYLPEQVVRELSDKSKKIALEGESRMVTVMFCDLRNFTSMSELLQPQDVVLLLNGYFTAMTDVLFKYGATIDKYMGDSIMAFWGAPFAQADHMERAIKASFEMHKEILNVANLFHARNLPTPSIGIGINSGTVNVGNMGSSHRLNYTVIGDAVNLAFRLQTATRDYQVGTIVGEASASHFPDMLFRELDKVAVRGKTQVTHIYEPLYPKSTSNPELAQQLALHRKALAFWYDKQSAEALELFCQLAQQHPEDLYYKVMVSKLQ